MYMDNYSLMYPYTLSLCKNKFLLYPHYMSYVQLHPCAVFGQTHHKSLAVLIPQ